MADSELRVMCVGLKSFDSGPLWWIGYYIYGEDEEEMSLEDVDCMEDFASMFDATQCIETHPPEDVVAALQRAAELSRKEKLPLYRVTTYRDKAGSQCQVFEAM